MPDKLRVAVLVNRQEYDTFKAYSEATGVPVTVLVRAAMMRYAARLEEVQK